MCCKHLITGLQNENLYPILEAILHEPFANLLPRKVQHI